MDLGLASKISAAIEDAKRKEWNNLHADEYNKKKHKKIKIPKKNYIK